jgi:hypothetical protein
MDNSPSMLIFYSICHKALALTNTLAYYRIRTLQIRNVVLSNCPRGGICKSSHDIKMFILRAVEPSLLREKFVTQLCLQIWSDGMLALLASPLSDVILSQLAFPLMTSCFVYIQNN